MSFRFDYFSPVSRSVFVRSMVGALVLLLFVNAIPESEFHTAGELYGLELFSKASSFFTSDSNPDVIMLGSSLVIGPALACDNSMLHITSKVKGEGHWYAKAHYFERLLQQQTRAKQTVFNLALPAAMMSDQFQLLEQALSSGKKPDLVIFGLAPRDFLANDMPKPASTPIGKELKRFRIEHSNELTPACLFEKLSLATTRQTESLQHKSSGTKSILSNRLSTVFSSICPSQRREQKEALSTECFTESSPKSGREKQTEKQLNYYKWVYNPYRPSIFDVQSTYLRKALEFAKENSIAVLIVDMPLSRANKALLDPQAYARYLQTLEQTTNEFSVAYLDLGSNSDFVFDEDEFDDSVHLGLSGGRKFFHAISKKMADDPRLAKTLSYVPH